MSRHLLTAALLALAVPAWATNAQDGKGKPVVWVKTGLPLPMDVVSFSAHSALSKDFSIHASLELKKGKLKLSELLGRQLTFSVLIKGEQRIFDGLVLDAQRSDQLIEVKVNSALSLLRKTADIKPFLGLSYPGVVKKVLARHPFVRYRFALQEQYPKRSYTVQYRETDRNFIDRLLEQVGIYYYFEHSLAGHTVVFTDNHVAHKGKEPVARFCVKANPGPTEQPISSWMEMAKLVPGHYSLVDDDPEVKGAGAISASWRDKEVRHPFAKLGFYDYPGEFESAAAASWLARRRTEELTSQRSRVSGQGESARLATGQLIDVSIPGKKAGRYLVISDSLVWQPSSDAPQVLFEAIPYALQFRPQRNTAKPIINGLQVARVVGTADAQGQVRLRFRWARQKSQLSGWVPVTGQFATPSGSDVIVGFAEGDPDRPYVIGLLQ